MPLNQGTCQGLELLSQLADEGLMPKAVLSPTELLFLWLQDGPEDNQTPDEGSLF